jgi:uncharacterized membrane protein
MNIKKVASVFFITVVLSLFIGFMLSTAGAALYPPINKIATPFVCFGGKMDVEEQTFHPAPGETVTTQTWSCVDGKTGESHKLGILFIALFVIPLYAVIAFFPILVIVLFWQFVIAPRDQKRQQQGYMNGAANQFKAMRDSGRINQQQYDAMVKNLKNDLEKDPSASPVKAEIKAIRDALGSQQPMVMSSMMNTSEAQLKKLKELLDTGLITQQDYDKKKAEILSRL